MKKIIILFSILLSGAMSSFAGTVTIVLNAGDLTTSTGAAISDGSLLLLVSAGADGVFYNMLQAGQFTGGDDVLLGAQAVNNNQGSSLEATGNAFNFDSATAGQAVEIVWFSDFTLAQYQANETPVAGQLYGTFAGITSGTTNGGDAWIVPGAGSTTNLNFVTQSANTGLSLGYPDAYPNESGEAAMQVAAVSVPEPGTWAFFTVALLAGAVFVRRGRVGPTSIRKTTLSN